MVQVLTSGTTCDFGDPGVAVLFLTSFNDFFVSLNVLPIVVLLKSSKYLLNAGFLYLIASS